MLTLYIAADLVLLITYSTFFQACFLRQKQGFADEMLLLGRQLVAAGGRHGQAVEVQALGPPRLELGVRLLQGFQAEAQVQERYLLTKLPLLCVGLIEFVHIHKPHGLVGVKPFLLLILRRSLNWM